MVGHREKPAADILLVEDNPGDVRLIEDAFSQGSTNSTLHVVTDGKQALDFLNRQGSYANATRPDLVLLDLNVPRVSGFDVLARIRAEHALSTLPVIVLTGSRSADDVALSYRLHANAYVTKPPDPRALARLVRTLEEFWLTVVELPTGGR
ncbi:response regulator [Natrononativus amylolyticus]|uniref:response regulator n=1 Tax=Natrononativus amylolyticus TaxID=2963434 RepID=UPI0020CFB207|nr:response regulator [Natrononativus amylolyticus]